MSFIVTNREEAQHLLVVKYLVTTFTSFNSLNHHTFRDIFGPYSYIPPARDHFATLVDNYAVRVCHLLQQQLSGACSDLACTMDGWTDKAFHQFVGITAHYLDLNFEMVTRCFNVIPLSDKHTAEAIEGALWDGVSFYIKDRNINIISVTTDNGANMKKAI